MTIKGSLQMSIPIVKAYLSRDFRKSRQQLAENFGVLGGNGVEM